jgi:hypothetical protein
MIALTVRGLVGGFAVAWFASSAFAVQSGPLTLETLLNPTQDPAVFSGTAPPPAGPAPSEAAGSGDRDSKGAEDSKVASAKPAVAPAPKPVKRLPVPAPSAVDEATQLIEQVYEEQIKAAATSPAATIRMFCETADKTTDPSRTYALLMLAERLSVESGDVNQALQVIGIRATRFDVDALTARHSLLATVVRSDDIPADETLFEQIVATANQAVGKDQFDLADSAVDLAMATAKRIEKEEKVRIIESRRKRESPPDRIASRLLADASQLQKAVRDRRRQAFEFATARDAWAKSPEDASSAEIVGRYLCFVRNDWKAGLAALASGQHDGFRTLASREVALAKDPAADATARLRLANEWWKLAESDSSLTEAQVLGLKAHASRIYGDIEAKLTDPIDVALARKRASQPPPPAAEPSKTDTTDSLPSTRR